MVPDNVLFEGGAGETVRKCRDADLSTLSIGPKFTLRYSHFSPFLEVLGGDQRLYPEGFHHIDKLGLMAGGGLDINITRHFALRPISADFLTMSNRVDFEHLAFRQILGICIAGKQQNGAVRVRFPDDLSQTPLPSMPGRITSEAS